MKASQTLKGSQDNVGLGSSWSILVGLHRANFWWQVLVKGETIKDRGDNQEKKRRRNKGKRGPKKNQEPPKHWPLKLKGRRQGTKRHEGKAKAQRGE